MDTSAAGGYNSGSCHEQERSIMNLENIMLELSIIFAGAAVLGTLFLFTRQPILIAYIALGFAIGPNGLGWIRNTSHIESIAHIGVILLLFLAGLNLTPQRFLNLFRETVPLTLCTSLVFAGVSLLFALAVGFEMTAAVVFGASMMFSSTVVGLKLVPTNTLHNRRTGEFMTGVLLFQDVLAILVIVIISGQNAGGSSGNLMTLALLAGKLAGLSLLAFAFVRFVVLPLFGKFSSIPEYIFIASLGWCLLLAKSANLLGLSYEMGAFLGGISIASSPVSLVIAERLKPLREFFLILFFFAVGAELNFRIDIRIIILSFAFGLILVPLKASAFLLGFRCQQRITKTVP